MDKNVKIGGGLCQPAGFTAGTYKVFLPYRYVERNVLCYIERESFYHENFTQEASESIRILSRRVRE